jgi:hypothetical protein
VIQFRSPYAFRQFEAKAFQRARVCPFWKKSFQQDFHLQDAATSRWPPVMFVYRGNLSFDEFNHYAVRI